MLIHIKLTRFIYCTHDLPYIVDIHLWSKRIETCQIFSHVGKIDEEIGQYLLVVVDLDLELMR